MTPADEVQALRLLIEEAEYETQLWHARCEDAYAELRSLQRRNQGVTVNIFIEDSFDAAHWLPNVPEEHKCRAIHGHTYRVRLEVAGDVDTLMGWVMDYADVKAAWDLVKASLDHKCLNDLIENSTCENVALFIRDAVKLPLKRIEIRETERCGVVLDC